MGSDIRSEDLTPIIEAGVTLAIHLIQNAIEWRQADEARRLELEAEADQHYGDMKRAMLTLGDEQTAQNAAIDSEADKDLPPPRGAA